MKRTTWMMAAVAKSRQVKAMSIDQIRQYLAGGDMGYSKPAEVHDFPSPAHVLRFAEEIRLAPEQRAAAELLLATHKTEAQRIGAKVIEAERGLETLFRLRRVQPAGLASAVRRLARAESEYRFLHLETNRQMHALLTDEQVAQYAELRRRFIAARGTPAATSMKGDVP